MKVLLLAESDDASAVEARLREAGHDVIRVPRAQLEGKLAAEDGPLVVLVARENEAKSAVIDLRASNALAPSLLLAVTDASDEAALAALYEAGADDCVAWPRESALLVHRVRGLEARMRAARDGAIAARVEHELRTSEERLRTLVDLASDAIFIKDREGRYVLMNPAGARALGRTQNEIIGRRDEEIFGAEEGHDVVAHDQIAMRSRQPIHYEARRAIAGEDRVFTTSKFAYVSSEGDLLGIAGITRDITELRRSEEAERLRTRQRLAHQAALLALAQLDTSDFVTGLESVLDKDGETLAVERVSFWSFRDDPPTVVSRSMRHQGSGSWANALDLRARHFPRYFETLQENKVVVANDAPRIVGTTELTTSYLDPNGIRAFLDAPVWLRGSLVGVVCHEHVGSSREWTTEEQDFATSIGQMVSIQLGDRERDLAEAELRRSESRQRALIEHLPDAILVHREGRFVFVNGAFARYLGYAKSEDVIGRKLVNVVHADDRAEVQALEAGSHAPRKVRFLRRDGEVVSAEVASLALVFDGEPSMVAIARDLTERNRLEAQLLLADRMASVGTLAAGVAHEINNPLGYVLGNLNVLANGLSGDGEKNGAGLTAEMKQALQDAVHGAKRVRDIVHDLQTFSRGDSQKRGAVDVLRVMDVSIRMAYSALRHRAQLVRDYQEVPPAFGNESRLGQVFLNLLVNAAQAMPDRPLEQNEVKVTIRREGPHLIVEVKDNGVGMTESVRRRVFDPFYTTKTIGEGTGLGLSICHSIVVAMGGTISLTSEPQMGSTFTLALPLADGAADAEAIEEAPQSMSRRERVLVIDDEPMIGVMIRRLLAAHCDVLPVTNPREALRRIGAQERFDAILCDLMMPRMNGIEFFAELRALAPDLARRTGFLTGGAVTPQSRKFLQENPDRYLEKPVELGKLRAFVHMLASAGDKNTLPPPPPSPLPSPAPSPSGPARKSIVPRG